VRVTGALKHLSDGDEQHALSRRHQGAAIRYSQPSSRGGTAGALCLIGDAYDEEIATAFGRFDQSRTGGRPELRCLPAHQGEQFLSGDAAGIAGMDVRARNEWPGSRQRRRARRHGESARDRLPQEERLARPGDETIELACASDMH
jgi:hypothetical protein